MIKVRLSILGKEETNLPIMPGGENLEDTVRSVVLSEFNLEPTDGILSNIHAVLNGHLIPKDKWPLTRITEKDTVLLAPRVAGGGGFGNIVKQAVTIVAPYALQAFGGVVFGTPLAIFGTAYLVNKLIPQPTLDLGFGGFGGREIDDSQMYTISSQANEARKYRHVPKVYGTHRVFPSVAATPYVEIETDPTTGKLVQYFTAIYDFGMGPLEVNDIRIGNTPIYDYSDVQYRLVDPNRPVSDEGSWDESLESSFNIYKGDIDQETLSLAINGNQSAGSPLSEYQILRTCSAEVNGASQEITIDFVCPNGLIAFNTSGAIEARQINLEIHFSKASEDIWRPYNDLTYVSNFRAVGGSTVYDTLSTTLFQTFNASGSVYTEISSTTYKLFSSSGSIVVQKRTRGFGLVKGATSAVMTNASAVIGDIIQTPDGSFRATITNKVAHSSGYSTYTFNTALTTNVVVYTMEDVKTTNSSIPSTVVVTSLVGSPNGVNVLYIQRLSLSKAQISRADQAQVYATFRFTPREIAQYKIRIVRKSSASSYTFQIRDALSLINLASRFDRLPILTEKRHVFMELRIKATNQLNGSISNLSGTCSSVLDVWNGSAWELQRTNNPAWVFADLLTGTVNKKALSKSRLHLTSLTEWANYCDEIPPDAPNREFNDPRFECNMVLDFDTTLQSVLNMVTNAAHASLNLVDGKYGVLIDKLRTTPVQIFTPRNSSNFSSTRSYQEVPHALKVKYVDPSANWEVAEEIAYDDGYNINTATIIEEMESFACTSSEQAWRLGRYHLAQTSLRRETIHLTVDFEHLVCTRGDYVQVSQDVMKVGGRPARVKSIAGTVITIDDGIDTLPATTYQYNFRAANGTIYSAQALTVIDSNEFDLAGTMPAVGDLIVIGEVGEIVIDCIVQSITPSDELTAELILVEKADGIYDAENGADIPDYDPHLSQVADTDLAIPGEVDNLAVVDNTYRVVGRQYQYYIELDWDVPAIGAAYESFEVYADAGLGYQLVDVITASDYEYIVDTENLGVEHKFKVLAVSSTGKKLTLGEVGYVTATPEEKSTPPSDVTALYLNITGEVLQIEWPAIPDEDVDRYLIRYSPVIDEVWERSIPLMYVSDNMTMAMTQARTGTYFIKARDFNGNESAAAAKAFTSIPQLFNLNVIDETNDFPALLGNKDAVVSDGTSLMLQELVAGSQYYAEGYYYYENHLDLGEIYSVRLQSLIEAEGFTFGDLMSNWVTLDTVVAMSNTRSSEWDVETQVRYTNQYNVMSEWADLDSIDPISEGNQDIWNDWRKFTIGDYTGRIFQFRLKLISNAPSVTPRVFEGKIKSDMPDRIDSYNNIVSGVGAYTLTYTIPFKGPGTTPAIQITQDDAEGGDYFKITNKTLNGFDITFYDIGNNIVSRQFDAMVKGYGRLNSYVI